MAITDTLQHSPWGYGDLHCALVYYRYNISHYRYTTLHIYVAGPCVARGTQITLLAWYVALDIDKVRHHINVLWSLLYLYMLFICSVRIDMRVDYSGTCRVSVLLYCTGVAGWLKNFLTLGPPQLPAPYISPPCRHTVMPISWSPILCCSG